MSGICRYDKHTVNTRDELSGVDVMTLPEAQEASEQWQSVSNYYTDLYLSIKEEKGHLLHIKLFPIFWHRSQL